MSERTKIAFMFGAGAEGKGNYNICTGFGYLVNVFFNKENYDSDNKNKKNVPYRNVLSDYFKDNKYTKITIDTIDAKNRMIKQLLCYKIMNNVDNWRDEETKLKVHHYLKNDMSLLEDGSDDVRSYVDELEKIESKNNSKNTNESKNEEIEKEKKERKAKEKEKYTKIETEIVNILKGEIDEYEDIQEEFNKRLFDKDENGKIELDFNVAISNVLDTYFHTIASPIKYGPIKFSKIFNYYWCCYFVVLKYVLEALNKLNENKFEKYFDNEKLNYEYVLEHIHELTQDLYDDNIQINKTESYYDCIRNQLNDSKESIECKAMITTNYFRFGETIFEDNKGKCIYLNGQLKYFENPMNLEVIDLCKDEFVDQKLYFPFVFGQSMVKPIISPTQTEEFHELFHILKGKDSIDTLVVIGYNLNDDDNHINAFLHQFIKLDNKRIIVLEEVGKSEEEYRKKLINKLHLRDQDFNEKKIKIVLSNYKDNKKTISDIFEQIKKL